MPPSTSGGSVIAPMVLMTPSTAATMPSAGRPSAMDLQRIGADQRLVMVLFELLFHRGFDLVRVFQAHGHHPQRVADEVEREMVLHDLGIALEDRGLRRAFRYGLPARSGPWTSWSWSAGTAGRAGRDSPWASTSGPEITLPSEPPIFFMLYIEPAISMAAMAAPKMVSISCGSGLDHHAQRAAGHQVAAEHAGEKNDDAADLKHGKPAIIPAAHY